MRERERERERERKKERKKEREERVREKAGARYRGSTDTNRLDSNTDFVPPQLFRGQEPWRRGACLKQRHVIAVGGRVGSKDTSSPVGTGTTSDVCWNLELKNETLTPKPET